MNRRREMTIVWAGLLGWLAIVPGYGQEQVPTLPGHAGPLKVYIGLQDAALRQSPDETSRVMQRADYLDLFYVAGRDVTGEYYLLATADADGLELIRRAGWLARRDCLEMVHDRPLECLRHPQTGIYSKAMLVNRLDASQGVAGLQRPVEFLDRPDAHGESRTQRALFDIYYIFAERSGHVLLGREPRVNRDTQREAFLLGWVPLERVCRWNTREALEFNKANLEQRRQRPSLIFETREDLRRYTDFSPETPYIAKEDLSVREWRYYQPRFPLLDDEDFDHQGRPYQGWVRFFKIGAIGDVWMEGEDGLQMAVTARQVEVARQRVRELREQASIIQICFVIDATFSMNRWFPAVAESVRSIIDSIQSRVYTEEVSPAVQISLNFYRDPGEGPRQFEGNPFLGASAALAILEQQMPLGGHDTYELVFAGICRSLEAHPFSPEATKILVLIGDDGNDPEDREYTRERVTQALLAAGDSSPVGFCALAVGGGDLRAQEQRSLFERQTREIAEQLAVAERARYQDRLDQFDRATRQALEDLAGQVVVTDDPEAVVAAILGRFEVALAEMSWQRRRLDALESGAPWNDQPVDTDVGEELDQEMLRTYGVIWQERMRQLVRREGLEPLELAQQGVQLFSEGWIADVDPLAPARPDGQRVPQIRHRVLMHRSELRRLVVLLDLLIQNWNEDAIEQTWRTALATIVDPNVQVPLRATPAELLKMHLGIKAKEGILAVPLERFAQSAADRAELRRTLIQKHNDLLDVLEERHARYWWGDERRGDDLRAWIGRELLP